MKEGGDNSLWETDFSGMGVLERKKAKTKEVFYKINKVKEENKNLKDEIKTLKKKWEKYELSLKNKKLSPNQEFTQSYDHHCNEIVTLKNSYETTINNLNIKISDLN